MSSTFTKSHANAPAGLFQSEAAGLEWLQVPDGPRVVQVHEVGDTYLELERLPAGSPSTIAATDFGRRLARLHDHSPSAFGALPPNAGENWFFGPLESVYAFPALQHARWSEFFVAQRLKPLQELLAQTGHLDSQLVETLDRLGQWLLDQDWAHDVAPARVHGDLWSGNLMWVEGEVVLIDPAAHANHPFTDLAMLELFGCPHLPEILDGYYEVSQLPAIAPFDVALHQIFPIGMHVVLFGSGFRPQFEAVLNRVTSVLTA